MSPVSVKEYLNSMKQMSSSQSASAQFTDLKTQALLSQLIEAIAYANSIDFRQKALNSTVATSSKTGKEVLSQMKAQESLVKQLAEGQKLSSEQNKKLTDAIDRFYELTTTQEVNYKKFAAELEKFALQDLPEAVQTRLINDSRDAHIIGTDQKRTEGPILPIIKKIKYLLEDSAEATKQFSKKFFVTLDEFKEGLLGAFETLGEQLSSGTFFDNLIDGIKNFGMLWMLLQGKFKMGDFKFGQLVKQIDNIKAIFKGFKGLGPAIEGITKGFKFLKGGKGLMTAFKAVGKGFGKAGLKKIPLLGTLLSIWMGIERWQKKDYVGALIEFGSGVAALFPGVGTLISIGLDLVNLGRDTGFFKKTGDTTKKFWSNLSDKAKMGIPIIGQIFGIKKAIDAWKSGDILGALSIAGEALSPFGQAANMIEFFKEVFNLDASGNSTSANSSSGKKWWNPATWSKKGKGDKDFGDAPIKWNNESGNYSPKGLTSDALAATENFNKLLGGGLTVTSAFRDPSKMKALWESATPIPGSRNRINKYGNEMADPYRSNHAKGLAVDVPMSLYKKLGAGKFTQLAKKAGFNIVYPEKTAVHLEVAKSGSKIAKIDKATESLTASASEPLYESSESIASVEAKPSMTFDEMLKAFNQFNEQIIADVQSPKDSSTVSSFSQFNQDVIKGMPNATQSVQTAMTDVQPTAMDKEIQDTDLAILNSLLFS